MQEAKPYAPFGALFHLMRSEVWPLKYHPYFFCGRYAYEEAKQQFQGHGQLCLCLPFNRPFDSFSWSIQGLSLVLFDTGEMTAIGLNKLAYAILKQGAALVAIYSPTKGNKVDVFSFKPKKDLSDEKGKQ